MKDGWDPKLYRNRSKQWENRAMTLPEGKERGAYLMIAEGYAQLAQIIEEKEAAFGASSLSDLTPRIGLR